MSQTPPHAPDTHDLSWLGGGGEMGALIRSMDWSRTPLGPLQDWPQSLRTSVSLCMSSTFPILVAWGPHDIQLYNDAYRPICGELHPRSMGAPFKEIWASALPVVGAAFDRAHKGEGAYIRDQRMFLDRHGYLEEAFMTFSFSPIRDESGDVGGIFHPITEATSAVLNARRSQCLRDLTAAIADSRSIGDVGRDLEAHYASMALDLPFVLLYQLEPHSGHLLLRGGAGLDAHPSLAPALTDLNDACWPFARAMDARAARQVDGLAARFAAARCGPYDNAPDAALVLPILVPGLQDLYGFVVAGVSAARALDADYRHFYELLGATINTAVGNVIAYEQEQRRAEELAQIDRAKTAFFSNVSHEFRTPLTLILGPLEDALADQTEPLGPAQQRRLELTRRNALRLLKLVNSLLDFSRIEAGRVQATYAPLDLARLTAELTGVFESAMKQGGLGYRIALQQLDRPVYVDRDMWEKIVFNLLSNAFKFTLQGSVTVTLAQHGELARLSVQDTGSGIAADELASVFERFHRIEGTPGRTYEGTGIGLALIEELVRLHGGTISVHSELGVGSRFDVDIPFGHAHLPAERLSQPDADAEPAGAGTTGAAFVEEALRWLPDDSPAAATGAASAPARALPRVLIADDNHDMRAYLKALLEPHAEVSVCADGEAAFALLQRQPVDLLVSDVMMPRLDGFGLIARIRADPALGALPVMLLSARAGEEAKVEGLQAGADDYMVKPFAATELLARVQRQLAMGRERRLQREALEMREHYFRSLVDLAPVMLWTIDADGACTYFSQRWWDYTGRSAARDLGLRWLRNVHPDDSERVSDLFHNALTMHAPFSFDYRLRRHDGAYRWFVASASPRSDDDGRSAGYVGTSVDIHARTMLKQRLDHVTRAADIGVWYADAPFHNYHLNEQLAAQMGLGHLRDATPAALRAAVSDADRARFGSALALAQHRGAAFDLEYRSAADQRWLRAIGWCDLGADGQPVRFDGVSLDITSHKIAEHELRRLADELREKNRMQSEFLSTLAHELRNPLAPIRTGLDLMRMMPATASTGMVQATMRRQIDHMAHLLEDLLDMARLSEGKIVLKRESVSLEQVVGDAIEISMPLIDAGGHTLERRLPAALTLHVDRHRLTQVLSNLVNNAAKYTPPGGRIALEARVRANSIAISVTDNGIGIDAAMLPAVFDMYAQAHRSHNMSRGGLGVGLNLVRRLVELHGGTVEVASGGAGQGSRFTVCLPLDEVAPAVPSPSAPAPAATAATGAGALRVLVVDDNVDAAQMLGALLEMRGHAVTLAHDGAGALAAAASVHPQLVFLDIGLPDQSGLDIAPALRTIDGMANATLVALTGWGTERDRERTRAAGFDAHLTKPADLPSVERLLREVAPPPGST
ncbi:diguanylate cyclase [Massilia eurypsychrophila]|uniref:histidine kinase n=1 Tax=Massilia eurypsychrophila TaxID=1485217 RepID=A0A2G8THQ5_9BURK|nr:ATP-binding protein [Massilia eurypsychrophila]PIL45168.1 diguanylate cyclase [Massilia eurypsychrophila]